MQAESKYRLILADDDASFLHSLKRKCTGDCTLEVTGEASDGLELINILKGMGSAPDMAIIDISMPNLGGIETTSQIKRSYPRMKVLILTMHQEKEYLIKVLSVGADGYLLKEDADAELFSAIKKIRRGEIYISLSMKTHKEA